MPQRTTHLRRGFNIAHLDNEERVLVLGVIFQKILSYADRGRIVESLTKVHDAGCTPKELDATIRKLNHRWFLTRNVHQSPFITLVQPRWALSYMRGPMTLGDIKRALGR